MRRWRRRALERLRRWVVGAMLLPPAFACGVDEPLPTATDPGDVQVGPEGVPPPTVHAPPSGLGVELLGPELGAPAHVLDLGFDAGGGLWIAGSDGLYVRPAGGHFFTLLTIDDGLARAPMRSVGGLGPGAAVVGFEGAPAQLVRIHPDGTVVSVVDAGLGPLLAEARAVDLPEGRFVLAATGAGLAILDADGDVIATRTLPGPQNELWSVAATAGGDVWVGDVKQLARIEGPFVSGLGAASPVLDLVSAADDDVVAIEVCPDGDVWASVLGKGVIHLTAGGQEIERLTQADVLPQDHVPSLACDLDGSLWIGTSWGGLARRSPDGSFRYHAATVGLPGDSIRSLLIQPDGAGGRTLWIGTDGGAASYSGP